MVATRYARILIFLLVLLGLFVNGVWGANILFVTAEPADPEDAPILAFLEGLGHTVTIIDDGENEPTTEAAAAAADLVFISESVGSSAIRNEITEIATPMIIAEAWAWDEMGLTEGAGGGLEVASTDIEIVSPDHFLAAGLSGTVPVLTATGEVSIARFSTAVAGTGATVIATATLSDGQTYDVLYVYEQGAPLAVAPADGSAQIAAGMRICLGFDEISYALWNENAYELLAAAVNYGLGITELARNPRPSDGARNVGPTALQWSAGRGAVWHNVYFGTNPPPGAADLVSERQTDTVYALPADLVPQTTYYWRIDEIEADGSTIHPGAVWSFTAARLVANGPTPADGAVFVDPDVDLSWIAGYGAATHDVYLGTNQTAVQDATVTSPQFQGSVPATSYDPGTLARSATYYWRIDEVSADGATVQKGSVWRFSTVPDISVRDPNLVGWWKLEDEGIDIVMDYSGHSHHGTLSGNLQWVFGYDGDALDFDGASYVTLPAGLTNTNRGSVTAWIKTTLDVRGMIFYAAEGNSGDGFGGQNEFHAHIRDGGDFEFFIEGGDTDTTVRASSVNDDTWHHVAATWAAGGDVVVYVDGEAVTTRAHTANSFEALGATRLGAPISDQRYYVGLLDDARLYDYVLSAEQVVETMKGDPMLASNPSPANRSVTDVERGTTLTWSPGANAAEHHVYFGMDRTAVTQATSSDATGVYQGVRPLGDERFELEDTLEFDQTYYWRIDERNADATLSKGVTWSFTVADYLIVDDFESYSNNSPQQPFQTWTDGFGYEQDEFLPGKEGNETGSQVGHDVWSLDSPYFNGEFMEKEIVHSGRQALPFYYDNSGPGGAMLYSEIERAWSAPQDWTRNGVTALSLFFQGNPQAFTETPSGHILISATGTDIWGTADEFRFVHKRFTGDGAIVARVQSVDNTDPWAKAGVMIRDTLAAGSEFGAVYITPGNGCRFHIRTATEGAATSDTSVATPEQQAITAPYWVKLERVGMSCNGYYSADPATAGWTAMSWNPQTLSMPGNIYIGLAVTSHSAGDSCIAEFSGIEITGDVTGDWEVADIGVPHPNNAPGQLYVALEDSGGRVAVVNHPDGPASVQLKDWTDWTIDLSQFSSQGVRITDVEKMMIGVGDRDNPAAGGSGRLLIDDITLQR